MCSDSDPAISTTDTKEIGAPCKQVSTTTKAAVKSVKRRSKTRYERRRRLIHLGGQKYVTIRKRSNHVCVNIRSYLDNECSFSSATKRGIMLTPTEWESLKANIVCIDNQLNVLMHIRL